MLTLEKIKEYELNNGSYEGFYYQRIEKRVNVLSDQEWYLINDLIQDIQLVDQGLTAVEFIQALDNKLEDLCDNKETIQYLKEVAKRNSDSY
jgi:hypothetical protein